MLLQKQIYLELIIKMMNQLNNDNNNDYELPDLDVLPLTAPKLQRLPKIRSLRKQEEEEKEEHNDDYRHEYNQYVFMSTGKYLHTTEECPAKSYVKDIRTFQIAIEYDMYENFDPVYQYKIFKTTDETIISRNIKIKIMDLRESIWNIEHYDNEIRIDEDDEEVTEAQKSEKIADLLEQIRVLEQHPLYKA
jgi:hypothetical protein